MVENYERHEEECSIAHLHINRFKASYVSREQDLHELHLKTKNYNEEEFISICQADTGEGVCCQAAEGGLLRDGETFVQIYPLVWFKTVSTLKGFFGLVFKRDTKSENTILKSLDI
jgi:hypothetical protein